MRDEDDAGMPVPGVGLPLLAKDDPLCPACNGILNGASNIEGEYIHPQEDDMSVCAGCGTLLVYVHAGTRLREATDEDVASLRREQPRAYSLLMNAQYHIRHGIELRDAAGKLLTTRQKR